MQAFLNAFVDLPSLLYQMDALRPKATSQSTNQSEIEKQALLSLFADVSARLDHWENTLTSSPFSYGRYDFHPNETGYGHHLISFPNVTMANIFTHLWAFQIITLREMNILTALSGISSPLSTPPDRAVTLARTISLSMEYLLRKEMGLFGPASSHFPLKVAWDVLGENGDYFDFARVKGSVDRLVSRGLLSAPILFFGLELECSQISKSSP